MLNPWNHHQHDDPLFVDPSTTNQANTAVNQPKESSVSLETSTPLSVSPSVPLSEVKPDNKMDNLIMVEEWNTAASQVKVSTASRFKRFIAFLMDTVFLVTVLGFIDATTYYFLEYSLISIIAQDYTYYLNTLIYATLGLVAFNIVAVFLYYTALEWSPLQGTIGKAFFGLKVVSQSGGRMTLKQALWRNIVRLSFFIIPILVLFDGLWALKGPEKQTWHDSASKTFICK